MKRLYSLLLSLLICTLLLTACGGENTQNTTPPVSNSQTSADAETPSDETVGENKTTEGGEAAAEEPAPEGCALSAEALAEYADLFATMEGNGLLRFPYDNGADREQIAPYLDLLFYDIGETDLSDEERAALEAAGMFMELDEFRLSRAFVTEYLGTYLDMLPEDVNAMLSEVENPFGTYLPETDAWYMCHGDTAWMSYTFESGVSLPDLEIVKLYYTNPFLAIVLEDGEADFLTDQPMVVTLSIEGGEWRVLSNEILSSAYN